MKTFTAIDKTGKSIVDVLVKDGATLEEIRKEVRRQLNKNSSRRAFIPMWEEGGQLIAKES